MHPTHLPSDPASRPRRTRRRILVVGTAMTATFSLLFAGLVSSSAPAAQDPGDALRTAIQAAPDDLQTPFEESNGAEWTTEPESRRFWRDLDESTDRVEVDRIGSTIQGRPLQLVKVGEPAPQSVDEAAEGSVMLYICSIHGDENSGREACMQLARDMAATQDPAWERLLRQTTVLFINGNPDGWVANTRGNANGVDINRDYMELATPEGQAITRVIRDWKPDVLNDVHEYGPRQYYDTDLLHLWPRNRNADDRIHALAKRMSNDYSAPQVESQGYSAGEYGLLVKDGEQFLQVAGDEQARILRNYAGLQHIVGMLSETANEPLTPEEEADPALLNRRRVEVNYLSAVGSAEMISENRQQIARQTAAAERRATQQGADQSGVVYFEGQDNMIPTSSDEVEPEPMCGYQLTVEQRTALAQTMRIHGISWDNNAAGAFVTMAQPDQPVIPLLFDARSEFALTEAVPVSDC